MNLNNDEIFLIQRYLDGTLEDAEFDSLETLLLQNAEARATLRTLATVDLGLHDMAAARQQNESSLNETRSIPPMRTTSSLQATTWTRTLLTIAAMAIIGLSAALWLQLQKNGGSGQSAADRNIVQISAVGGEVIWTGNGGAVTTDLKPGALLTGGTIEAVGPRSYAELEFLDGSKVSVAGDSRLTFSDRGQKVLYLKEGNITSSVKPQGRDLPMLVHTRTAMLEVVGTDFKVKSEFDATSLNVTEGRVRLKRLSDGQVVDVPANERVLAAEGSELLTQPLPGFSTRWKSDLIDPTGIFGKWLPATDHRPPRLRPVHYRHTDPEGNSMMLMSGGFGIAGHRGERILLHDDSEIRIRGFAMPGQQAVFGFVTRSASGDFAGNYLSSRQDHYWMMLNVQKNEAPRSEALVPFEVVLNESDLLLSLELKNEQEKFQETPAGLVIESFFSVSPTGNFGLEIIEVEVVRAGNE